MYNSFTDYLKIMIPEFKYIQEYLQNSDKEWKEDFTSNSLFNKTNHSEVMDFLEYLRPFYYSYLNLKRKEKIKKLLQDLKDNGDI